MALDQELEQAASGLRYTEPGISMFGAARSTAAVMPEMLQLGQVMQMRSGMQQDAYQLRDMARREKAVFDEADEFAQLEETLLEVKDASPAERAEHLANFFTVNPGAASNARVREAVQIIGSSSKSAFEAKQQQAQEADFDFMQGLESDRRDMVRTQVKLGLEKVKAEQDAFTASKEAGQYKTREGIMGQLARSTGLDASVQSGILKVAGRFADNPAEAGLLEGLSGLVHGVSKSELLAENYSYELQEHAQIGTWLQTNGIQINLKDPPDVLEANLLKGQALAEKAAKENPEKGQRVLEAFMRMRPVVDNMRASMLGATAVRQKLQEDMPNVLAMADDPARRQELKDWVTDMGLTAAKFGAIVDGQFERRDRDNSLREKQLDLEKKKADILRVNAGIKLQNSRAEDIKAGQALARYYAHEKDVANIRFDIMNILIKEGSDENLKPEELNKKVDALMEGVIKGPSFEGASPVGLRKQGPEGASPVVLRKQDSDLNKSGD